jgi:DNA primase
MSEKNIATHQTGRIPRAFIDDLMARTDLVDMINSRVPLRKNGANFIACCPFHDEKTPSFTVSPSKQIYHCFGCGVSGNAIGFLMEFERLEFVEAIESLAKYHSLEVPYEGTTNKNTPRETFAHLYQTLELVNQFYQL